MLTAVKLLAGTGIGGPQTTFLSSKGLYQVYSPNMYLRDSPILFVKNVDFQTPFLEILHSSYLEFSDLIF